MYYDDCVCQQMMLFRMVFMVESCTTQGKVKITSSFIYFFFQTQKKKIDNTTDIKRKYKVKQIIQSLSFLLHLRKKTRRTMSSLTSVAVSLIFIIGICVLPRVSSDCSSCCSYGTGCDTAYFGDSGLYFISYRIHFFLLKDN